MVVTRANQHTYIHPSDQYQQGNYIKMNQGMKKQHLWDLLDCKSLADKEKKKKKNKQ